MTQQEEFAPFTPLRGSSTGVAALAEQERFAAKVARYERLRSQQREAERQAEMLFQSLLDDALEILSFWKGICLK